jgi:UDP-2,3-diacylglucosamine pyrophosphatase LpxH
MNTLVFSDTHLGKYDKEIDFFLKDLVKNFDRIIINGDFYDSWLIDFERFVNSEYKELIEILKNKETIYIYGNHDQKEDIDLDLLKTFTKYQGKEYDLKIGNRLYHIEHGDRFIDRMNNPFYKFYYKFLDIIPKFLRNPFYKISFLGYKLFPQKIGENRVGMKRNKYIKEIKPKNTFYILGDTHVAEVDMSKKYINNGCIIHDLKTYLVINGKGEPTLNKQRQL